MPRSITTHTRRRRVRTAALLALLGATLAVGSNVSPAAATTITFGGALTPASTMVVHKGDVANERTFSPTGSAVATIDDTAHTVTSGTTTFASSETANFLGPFNFWFYVQTSLEQRGAITGTALPSATPGITNMVLNTVQRLHVVVFKVAAQNSPHNPATDLKFTLYERCWSDLTLKLTGTLDRVNGNLHVAQDPFTIPTFPADGGDPLDANHRCQNATGALNTQVAGTSNSVDLTFAGGPTSMHLTSDLASGSKAHFTTANYDWDLGGSLNADVGFTSGKITNITPTFNSKTVHQTNPAITVQGSLEVLTPTGTVTPSGTTGIDNVTISGTLRMHLGMWYGEDTTAPQLLKPSACFVDVPLTASGTANRIDTSISVTATFALTAFPSGASIDQGCWFLASYLNTALVAPGNTMTLNLSAT